MVFAKRGFPVRCAGGQDEVDRFEERVSERNDGALITTSSFEGVIARLQALSGGRELLHVGTYLGQNAGC